MIMDKQGNVLSGATGEALDLYEQAVEAFNIYRGDPVAILDRAIESAPQFAMARILKAHLLALATEPAAAPEPAASGSIDAAGVRRLQPRSEPVAR